MTNKKLPAGTLLAAGLAAFAYYKYSKLTREEKDNIINDLKETGRNIVKELVPDEIKGFIPKILKQGLFKPVLNQ